MLPHTLSRLTSVNEIDAIIRAYRRESLVEQRMRFVESQLNLEEELLDSPVQHQVFEAKLQRAQMEVYVYSKAVARATLYDRGTDPEHNRSETL